jgi:hypothetical protein
MTSQHQYQLDNEYRNRRMAETENARLAQQARIEQSWHTSLGAMMNTVQRIVSNRPQAQSTARSTDTQTIPAVS